MFTFSAVLISALLFAPSLNAQQAASDPVSALAQSTSLQSQLLTITEHKKEFGVSDPQLIELLTQLADSQSLVGAYSDAIMNLEEAFEVSRINNGLFDASQIEIVDKLIANEVLLENWETVDRYYGWQEHLYLQLYELEDPRLEIGLEKVTAWHVSAVSENVDNRSGEHLQKIRDLMNIRLVVVENVIGTNNPRYDYLIDNLEIVEENLRQQRRESRRKGQDVVGPGLTVTTVKIE